MIVLDSTTISLQAVLAGAKTTNDAQCYCVYYDVLSQTKQGSEEYRRSARVQNTNGVTAVTVAAAPTVENITRVIETIFIHNYDTASITATVQIYNSSGTVTTRLVKQVLAADETLIYEREGGWQII